MFTAWRDALVVPVPKKGDLTISDNWRGISLLDVDGKLLGRIVQERLQCIAESVLPDSLEVFLLLVALLLDHLFVNVVECLGDEVI